MHEPRFTLSFAGKLREFPKNPMHTITPFGEARASSVDDEMLRVDLIDHAEASIEDHVECRERIREILGMGNDELYASAAALGLFE